MLKEYLKYTSHTVLSVREGSLNFNFISVFSSCKLKGFTDYTSGIRLPDRFKLSINKKNCPNVFDVVLFLLSSLVTAPSFMSISPLVLES